MTTIYKYFMFQNIVAFLVSKARVVACMYF